MAVNTRDKRVLLVAAVVVAILRLRLTAVEHDAALAVGSVRDPDPDFNPSTNYTRGDVYDESYCSTDGSLDQLARNMLNFSSPVGSPSYTKFKRVLDARKEFHLNMPAKFGIFNSNVNLIARMLRGYGMSQSTVPSTNPDDFLLVEYLLTNSACPLSDGKCSGQPRIFIQTEQYTRASNFKNHPRHCTLAPNCIVLDFSEMNLQWARKDHGDINMIDSFVLMPVMHQAPISRLFEYEPKVPKPLKDRSVDMAFHGFMSNRRNVLREGAAKYPNRTSVIGTTHDTRKITDTYKEAKVCLLVHTYASISGGEYHRLSEIAPFGCVPVMEHFSDNFGIDVYERCAGARFAIWTSVVDTAEAVLKEIDSGLYSETMPMIVDWWRAGILWEDLLVSHFGSPPARL
mmetsp:Transcript_9338/g.21702  ORF Transcript_9338/g.21702 Transcript_9338/m.21702 type:complete len:400 (+) Transcript_9338:73-1272(+)